MIPAHRSSRIRLGLLAVCLLLVADKSGVAGQTAAGQTAGTTLSANTTQSDGDQQRESGRAGQEPIKPAANEPNGDANNSAPDRDAAPETNASPTYRTQIVRGRVVWLSAALKEQFGISTVPEMSEQALAILSNEGELLPLVENLRGRAFRKDERLRNTPMEIWVRRYDKQPLVQILRIFELQEGSRFELDYWCDICAIPMYETGPCACCQDHNRLRKRPRPETIKDLDDRGF